MKRLPDPAHEALVSWMRSLTLAQHLPIARVCVTFTVLFGQTNLVHFWSAMFTARWVTFHDGTGRVLKPHPTLNPDHVYYRVTPLFHPDYTRLAGAVEEAVLVNS